MSFFFKKKKKATKKEKSDKKRNSGNITSTTLSPKDLGSIDVDFGNNSNPSSPTRNGRHEDEDRRNQQEDDRHSYYDELHNDYDETRNYEENELAYNPTEPVMISLSEVLQRDFDITKDYLQLLLMKNLSTDPQERLSDEELHLLQQIHASIGEDIFAKQQRIAKKKLKQVYAMMEKEGRDVKQQREQLDLYDELELYPEEDLQPKPLYNDARLLREQEDHETRVQEIRARELELRKEMKREEPIETRPREPLRERAQKDADDSLIPRNIDLNLSQVAEHVSRIRSINDDDTPQQIQKFEEKLTPKKSPKKRKKSPVEVDDRADLMDRLATANRKILEMETQFRFEMNRLEMEYKLKLRRSDCMLFEVISNNVVKTNLRKRAQHLADQCAGVRFQYSGMRNDIIDDLSTFNAAISQSAIDFSRRNVWTPSKRQSPIRQHTYNDSLDLDRSLSSPNRSRSPTRRSYFERTVSPQKRDAQENSLLFRTTYRTLMREDVLPQDEESVLNNSLSILSPINSSQYAQKEKLFLFARIKPVERFVKSCIQIVDNNTLDLVKPGEKHSFHFDKIYGPVHNQEEVWEDVRHTVPIGLEGAKKICFIGFGASECGKTYTLRGRGSDRGILPRFVMDLFQERETRSSSHRFRFSISALEVKGEQVTDLLAPSSYLKTVTLQNRTKLQMDDIHDFNKILKVTETVATPVQKLDSNDPVYANMKKSNSRACT
jgi:hypothetical protein